MRKLTTENPEDNIETALNLFYIKNCETWVRGGGPGPKYADVSLYDLIRRVVKTHIPDTELPEDDDNLSMMMGEWLFDGSESAEGLIATLYTAAWAFSELRHRLAAYEDTNLEPEEIKELCTDDVAEIAKMFRRMIESGEIDHLEDLLQAEKDGRLVALPCKVGDAIDKLFSHNEIIALWYDRPDDKEHSYLLWRGEAWRLPGKYKDQRILKFKGIIPERISDADTLNLQVTPYMEWCEIIGNIYNNPEFLKGGDEG